MKGSLQKLYYLIGEGFAKGTVFLIFPFFTNSFSKKEFGILSLFWAAIPVASLAFDLSQRSYVKIYYLDNKSKIFELLKNLYFFSFLMFGVFSIVLFTLSENEIYLINKNFDWYLLISAFLFVLIEQYLSYLQIKGSALEYSIFYISRSSLAYILTVFFIWFNNVSINTYPISYIFILCCVFVFIIVRLTANDNNLSILKFKKKEFDKFLSKSLSFSLPLIFGTLSAMGLNMADRYIINYYYSEIEVANYTVGYTIASILMAFFLASNKWWQKFMLSALSENNISIIKKKFKSYLLLILIVSFGIYFFRKYLLLFLSNNTYLVALDIVPVLLLGMFFYFLYSVLINVPFYYKKTKIQILPALVAFLINLILNFWLLPKYGYKIAAYTTCVSYFLEFLFMYLICIYKFKIEFIFSALLINPLKFKK
ncbi:lipopolysaccharide biosynthesis protein [Hyunsoonleella ulvae]|uniref:lipopolysaccharide biosynthesis protein n=1 Tax=Hyunsoonleella ulvae TaxID=2799948 RepID=UPI00193A60D4|nr:polysaccharide biosynthesis C-terminal domain-containing protein [Hyunsoonleella ulvae]